MKAILNWRYYVLTILFAVGMICVFLPFGETTRYIPIGEWLVYVALLLGVGACCLYAANRCIDYWERRGLIPELTKLMEVCDGEDNL